MDSLQPHSLFICQAYIRQQIKSINVSMPTMLEHLILKFYHLSRHTMHQINDTTYESKLLLFSGIGNSVRLKLVNANFCTTRISIGLRSSNTRDDLEFVIKPTNYFGHYQYIYETSMVIQFIDATSICLKGTSKIRNHSITKSIIISQPNHMVYSLIVEKNGFNPKKIAIDFI